MPKKSCTVWILLCSLILLGGLVAGQSSSSSSASASASMDGDVQLSVGVFVVEQGSTLALEIVRDDPCTCLCDPIHVMALSLLDKSETEVWNETYDPPVDAVEWLGRLSLAGEESVTSLPLGSYKVVVETTAGRFSADLRIVPASEMMAFGRFSASASICGLELRVYRLITQQDAGASIGLRQGDRLMVALAGNATTGFEWSNSLLYEYAVLRETEEPEYRPVPYPKDMVGFGGTFLFRYEAIDAGPQAFRFIYHRPWESVQPEQVVEFDVTVY